MRTKVINLLGGSGLGKSTTAALVYGELKLLGHNAELVREFVKEWAWIGRKINPEDQETIFKEQLKRESMYYGVVEYIVTDSPLILGPIYEKFYTGKDPIAESVFTALNHAQSQSVEHINILLRRHKPFDTRGRYETEEQARKVDAAVENYLNENGMPFTVVETDDRQRVKDILTLISETNL